MSKEMPRYLRLFLEEVYGEYVDLALSSFSEKAVFTDAAAVIQKLKKEKGEAFERGRRKAKRAAIKVVNEWCGVGTACGEEIRTRLESK